MRGLDGFTPLQDQSAAGLLMMQVEGMICLAVVLLLVARMFGTGPGGAAPPTVRRRQVSRGESGAVGEPSRLRPRRPLHRYARLIAARSGMRQSPFQRLAAPIAVASRPAPARLASPVAWSPFAPPFARGVRPDGTGSASRPVLSTLAAAGSQSPVWRGMTALQRALFENTRKSRGCPRIAIARCPIGVQ